MFLVAGINGHIGGAAARSLLARGKQVRSLVRDLGKASTWAEQGVDLHAGDLTDADALATALDGMEGAFLLQPTPIGVTRDFPEAHALTDSIVTALDRSPPPRVVVLSSVGSEQDHGVGNITQTHILEQALDRFALPMAVVRAGSLFENYVAMLDRVRATGVFDSFLQPVDRPFPMVATADVGEEVARLLVEGWEGRRIVEVGSHCTPTRIAEALGQALDKPVTAQAIPRNQWNGVLAHMGLTPEQAVNWEEMQDGFNAGWIDFGRPGTEPVPGTTPPAAVFTEAVKRKAAG